MNITRPPLKDDPRLREALSLAVDRDKLARYTPDPAPLFHVADPAHQPVIKRARRDDEPAAGKGPVEQRVVVLVAVAEALVVPVQGVRDRDVAVVAVEGLQAQLREQPVHGRRAGLVEADAEDLVDGRATGLPSC